MINPFRHAPPERPPELPSPRRTPAVSVILLESDLHRVVVKPHPSLREHTKFVLEHLKKNRDAMGEEVIIWEEVQTIVRDADRLYQPNPGWWHILMALYEDRYPEVR